MPKFIPLGQRLLVKPDLAQSETRSGILIPDNAKDTPQWGQVLVVSAALEKEGTIKEGQRVVFGRFTGAEHKIDGEDYLILNEPDVLAILTD